MKDIKDIKDIDFKWSKILKILAVVLIGIILLSVFVNLVVSPMFRGTSNSYNTRAPMMETGSYVKTQKMAYDSDVELSLRNVTAYNNEIEATEIKLTEEDYEIKDYNTTIETANLDKTCSAIESLKGLDYVIFETSNKSDYNCSYSFKVDIENVDEIMVVIKDLNPRDLSENVKTIKKQIDDFTSQEDILLNKQKSIDETLENAVTAYDEITALATRVSDVESLAKIIDSKINIIERLTQERINISEQLDRISRAKAEQLDRLKYTYFNVFVYENKYFDWLTIKDSWKNSVKDFVYDMNRIFQNLSVGLVSLFFSTIQYLIYLFLVLVIVKYCWKLARRIWMK